MVLRNIPIVYFLVFSRHSFFWLGIWVLYYLKFTDYAGIGLLETLWILLIIIAEIPTGAIADLFGKKNTLLLAFALLAICNLWMAFTPNFVILILSCLIGGLGGAFYSGTIDALAYDSLKEKNLESRFDKVMANIGTYRLVAQAICGAIGGFLYAFQPSLPFIATGILQILAFIACLFIIEPKIDTEKFSLKTFLLQTKQGIRELTKTIDIKRQALMLITIGGLVAIGDEMLNSFLGVEFGYSASELGILFAVICLVAALASQITPYLKQKLGSNVALFVIGVLIAISYIVSPALGIIFGGVSILLRSSFQSIFDNLSTIIISNNSDSRYRVTTLSTFNTFKNIPYVLTAFTIGSLADLYSAKMTALVLGVVLLILILLQTFIPRHGGILKARHVKIPV